MHKDFCSSIAYDGWQRWVTDRLHQEAVRVAPAGCTIVQSGPAVHVPGFGNRLYRARLQVGGRLERAGLLLTEPQDHTDIDAEGVPKLLAVYAVKWTGTYGDLVQHAVDVAAQYIGQGVPVEWAVKL